MKLKFFNIFSNQRGEIAVAAPTEKVIETPAVAPAGAPEVSGLSSDKIKEALSAAPTQKPNPTATAAAAAPTPEANPADPAAPAAPAKEEDWFDKERGFKTKEDALNSYKNLQETLRQKSEREKGLQAELEQIKQKAAQRPLTPEEQERQASVHKWREENKDAINFLKDEIRKDLALEGSQQERGQQLKAWKEDFDKDPSRSVLFPVMDQIYKEEAFQDENGNPVFHGFFKNPLKYFEALAFQKDFPRIAEKIRAEAIEQYKGKVKEAEAAEKAKRTALPGGPKTVTGEVDPAKMSSSELAGLLPRNENG